MKAQCTSQWMAIRNVVISATLVYRSCALCHRDTDDSQNMNIDVSPNRAFACGGTSSFGVSLKSLVPVRYHERASISFCLAIQCISMTDSVSFRTSPKAFCTSNNNNQHGKTAAAAADAHRRHSSSVLCRLSRRRCRHVQCP